MLDEPSVRLKVAVPFRRLNDLLEDHARRSPDAPAILSLDREPLSYGRLYRQVCDVGRALRAMGIGREDRVAVLLPNGPDAAAAFICVASNTACAMINPAYAADELERYFEALRLDALIVAGPADYPARRVARARGIRVIELTPAGAEAGLFTLRTDEPGPRSHDPPGPGSIALILLTSGTTARPKIVPLTHANICAAAYGSVTVLALKESDRCLNMLPLFHTHGVGATLMTSLAAGASVVCTPGCDVNRFFAWLRDFGVTWYSAVPTMHQAILAQARHAPGEARGCRLRLVRSASAPLPPRVLAELERTFSTCVIELYGMTETAGAPIACNPLPPGRRKPGSCGIPIGLDVAVMSDSGNFLPRSKTGHVVIRGAAVTQGYDGDPAATAAAFSGDWFKTGDQGFFDDDGYLFLVGRTREMINRGGEKIAPREVDEALLEHPAVAEAATFAVPHATLGEDVAAAIVLRPQVTATAKDIRAFAMGRLAEFKVPRQVIFLSELPKSATGKVQRVGLAAKLGLASGSDAPAAFVAPRTPIENVLAGIWADVLQRDTVGIHDDFFALGGDSLLAAHALTCIHDVMHLKVDVTGLFDAPTVAEMAEHLEALIQAGQARQPSSEIVRISREDTLPASPAQERLWQLQQATPGVPLFNILYVLRLTSPVDAKLLERSFNAIVQRHEILRTTFTEIDSRLLQVIAPHLDVPLASDDLRKLPKTRRENAAHRLIQQELLHSYDLTHGPLVRTRLIRLAEAEDLFLVAMHQTIVDGWSLGVLIEELGALYEAFAAGRESPLSPLAIQYADFADWQRQWRSHPDVFSQLAYWREQLRDPLPALRLGTPRPRRLDDDLIPAQRDVTLPASLVEAARQLGHREGGTLFMTLVTALQILMHRYLGEDDLRVATNVANRNRPGTERLLGPLVNTVILRASLAGDPSAREAMRRIRATTLAAYANQDLPFEELADHIARERELDPANLARIMILLHNAALRPAASAEHALTFEEADLGMPMPLVTTTTYDVILVLRESAEGLVGSCIYKSQLFGAKSVDRLLRNFRRVLEQMVAQPDRPISAIHVAMGN